MAEFKVEGEELKKLIMEGKKRPMNFAFNPGPKKDHVVAIDRRKDPEVLGRAAKKEGAGSKTAFGTFVLEKKDLKLTCLNVVEGMAKKLKLYLKDQGVKVNVILLDASGGVLESDVEEMPDDDGADAVPAAEAADVDDGPSEADLEAAQKEIDEQELSLRILSIFNRISTKPKPVQEKLTKAKEAAEQKLKAGDKQGAKDQVDKIEQVLDKLEEQEEGAADADDPLARKWADVASQIRPRVEGLLKDGVQDANKLKALWALANQKADAGDFDTALKAVPAIVNFLGSARTADEKPADSPDESKALVARFNALKATVGNTAPPVRDKLIAALSTAAKMIKAKDLAGADTTLGKIEAALSKLGAASAPQEAAADASAAPDAKLLVERFNALKSAIGGVAQPARDKLVAALGAAAKSIKASDLAAAETTLARIEGALAKLGAAPEAQPQERPAEAANPDEAKWNAAFAQLMPAVDKAMAERRGDLAEINRAFGLAQDRAETGDFAAALKAAARTAQLLKEAAGATTSAAVKEAQENIPADVVPYYKSRLSWIKTRSDLRDEISKLKAAIDDTVKDIEGMEDVASKTSVLFDYLGDIDTALEETLEKLVETPDGEARESLKSDARKIIAKYQDVLDTDFFKDVDQSGFAKTNIRGSALASLSEVGAALAS